jgi:hypothetical protein
MENKLKDILEAYPDASFMIADGFNEAVIGVCGEKLVYSIEKIIQILCRDMSEEDAWDYYSYNIEGSYVGEQTPLYVELF